MVLCKVRLIGAWIKRREVVVRASRIRSEKLKEDRYREGYTRSLEGKRVKGDRDNAKHMWEQVKHAMVESAREVCGLVRVGAKNLKSVWWNDEVKGAIRRCLEGGVGSKQ